MFSENIQLMFAITGFIYFFGVLVIFLSVFVNRNNRLDFKSIFRSTILCQGSSPLFFKSLCLFFYGIFFIGMPSNTILSYILFQNKPKLSKKIFNYSVLLNNSFFFFLYFEILFMLYLMKDAKTISKLWGNEKHQPEIDRLFMNRVTSCFFMTLVIWLEFFAFWFVNEEELAPSFSGNIFYMIIFLFQSLVIFEMIIEIFFTLHSQEAALERLKDQGALSW